jgi:hypothetical protein
MPGIINLDPKKQGWKNSKWIEEDHIMLARAGGWGVCGWFGDGGLDYFFLYYDMDNLHACLTLSFLIPGSLFIQGLTCL